MILERIISVIIGYFCGLFLAGYVYGKSKHVDVRNMGSGNVGTTNTMRNLGVKAGILTLTGDVGKALGAMLIVWIIYHNSYPETIKLLELYAGLGTVLGHDFPVYMKFKGGKGIAATGGLLIGFSPLGVLIPLTIFIVIAVATKYVSLASIFGVTAILVQIIVLGMTGHIQVPTEYLMEVYLIFGALMVLGIGKHHANIRRLLSGTENKFAIKKNK